MQEFLKKGNLSRLRYKSKKLCFEEKTPKNKNSAQDNTPVSWSAFKEKNIKM